jgi:hypothetical protein
VTRSLPTRVIDFMGRAAFQPTSTTRLMIVPFFGLGLLSIFLKINWLVVPMVALLVIAMVIDVRRYNREHNDA